MKWFILLGALLAVSASGCGRRAGQCDQNGDCPAGQLCLVDHRCQAAPPAPEVKLSVAKPVDGGAAVVSEPRPLCMYQCREVARACKGSCKIRHPRGPGRHDCAAMCEVREHECRARARC